MSFGYCDVCRNFGLPHDGENKRTEIQLMNGFWVCASHYLKAQKSCKVNGIIAGAVIHE